MAFDTRTTVAAGADAPEGAFTQNLPFTPDTSSKATDWAREDEEEG